MAEPFIIEQYRLTQVYSTGQTYYSGHIQSNKYVKPETKKERLTRQSKAKMYTSWSLFNNKTEKIREVIQVNKPRHRQKI